MAMATHHDLKEAWAAIVSHPAYPEGGGLVTAADVDDAELRSMLEMFDAMPVVPGPGGVTYDLATPEHLGVVKAGWLRGGFAEDGMWGAEGDGAREFRLMAAEGFRGRYRQIAGR